MRGRQDARGERTRRLPSINVSTRRIATYRLEKAVWTATEKRKSG